MNIFHTIFFDLENTLIGHWTDRKLICKDEIKKNHKATCKRGYSLWHLFLRFMV